MMDAFVDTTEKKLVYCLLLVHVNNHDMNTCDNKFTVIYFYDFFMIFFTSSGCYIDSYWCFKKLTDHSRNR